MKITGLRAHLAAEWRTFLFVEIETDAGFIGLGEAGLTSRELAVAGALEHFAPLLVGLSPFDTEHIWQMLMRGGFFPAGVVQTSAIAAIDIALWDIKAQALGVPLYQLLGGKMRERVLTYTHLHGRGADGLITHADQALGDGWKCLRFEPQYGDDGVFDPPRRIDETIGHWDALRAHVGPEVDLAYDAHTRFGIADAIRLCRGIEPYRPFFIEDVLRSELADGYRTVRAQTAAPLAAGEQFAHKWAFKPLIDGNLIDYARIDLCIAGGITEALKIAAMCEAAGVDVAVHNPIGPVSTAACLHFNLAIPNMGIMELHRRPGETMADAVVGDLVWQDGYLLPPDAPGLGVKLRRDGLQRYPFVPAELPRLVRPDGSFQNW